ncbi:MAG: ThiF family adenylyltransferase [Chloroflexi bacterium]|nr:ThiF family adenylyltransferase [Chloroflexota bacterium]
MRNISPLTTEKAQLISGLEELDSPNILAVGCGALGSKIAMHLARAGLTNITLVDHDVLLPHNLVRHSLLAGRVSDNKADALREEIELMFRGQANAEAEQCSGIDILRGNKKHHLEQNAWLIDTTASKAFEQALIACQRLSGIRIMRAELAHRGQIGMMSIEGSKRNPRLDDIKVYLYMLACEQDYLSDWLKAGRKAEKPDFQFEEVPIGMGCHTDTMILADDVISFHAALMSTSLKHKFAQVSDEGYLQLSFLSHEGDVSRQQISVPTVEIFRAENDDQWEIRVTAPVKQKILESVVESAPNETGGILIGDVNPIHKVVYVTKVLPPPPDSRSTPYMFERGVKDIPDTVKRIQSRTGGLIDYVGEWHSHPKGGGQMSEQDKIAARQIQDILKSSGRPVHIMIATPANLHSHVYAGDTNI